MTNVTSAFSSSSVSFSLSNFQGTLGSTSGGYFTSLNLGSYAGTEYALGAGIVLTSGEMPNSSDTADVFLDGNATSPLAGLSSALEEEIGVYDTTDASVLSMSFTVTNPFATGLVFDWMYASEEYPEQYVTDIAAVVVDGVNYLTFEDDSNVRFEREVNDDEFTDAATAGLTSGYDGITAPGIFAAWLDPNVTNHTIDIVVSDTGDTAFDSALFLVPRVVGLDAATASSGDDVLVGCTGDNTIDAKAGNDIVFGMDGDDTITGGAGADVLYGGAGNDTFVIAAASEVETGDKIFGGTGTDTLELGSDVTSVDLSPIDMQDVEEIAATSSSGVAITVGALPDDLDTVTGGAGSDSLILSESISVDTFTLASIETVELADGVTLTITSNTTGDDVDTIKGTAGGANEVVTIADGHKDLGDTTFTDIASITLSQASAVQILTLDVNTALNGTDIIGTGGDDYVDSPDSLDLSGVTLTNIAGVRIDHGTNNPAATLTLDSSTDLGGAAITGGVDGDDVVSLTGSGTVDLSTNAISYISKIAGDGDGQALTLGASIPAGLTIDLGGGTDSLTLANTTNNVTIAGIETVTGGSENDTFVVAAAGDVAAGDQIIGGDGNDTLQIADGITSIDLSALDISGVETIAALDSSGISLTVGALPSGLTTISASGTADTLTLSQDISVDAFTLSGVETLVLADGVSLHMTTNTDGDEVTAISGTSSGGGEETITIDSGGFDFGATTFTDIASITLADTSDGRTLTLDGNTVLNGTEIIGTGDEHVLSYVDLDLSGVPLSGIELVQINYGDASQAAVLTVDSSTDLGGAGIYGGTENGGTVSLAGGGTFDLSASAIYYIDAVTGGADNDAVTLGTSIAPGLTVDLGAGTDSLTMAQTAIAGHTLNGGGDSDTLYITDGGTLTESELSGVTNFETWTLSGSGSTVSLTLGDSNVTSGGFTIDATACNSVTIDGSTVSSSAMALLGSTGADQFFSGGGSDSISLGSSDGASDTVHYSAETDSAVGTGDTINDFEAGIDTISLDFAVSGTFSYIGNTAFTGDNFNAEASMVSDGHLEIDTDGDGNADMEMTLTDVASGDLDTLDFTVFSQQLD